MVLQLGDRYAYLMEDEAEAGGRAVDTEECWWCMSCDDAELQYSQEIKLAVELAKGC